MAVQILTEREAPGLPTHMCSKIRSLTVYYIAAMYAIDLPADSEGFYQCRATVLISVYTVCICL